MVKIGYSVNPEARLKELQTGNPRKLSLIGTTKGSPQMEKNVHKFLKRYKHRGEWYPHSQKISLFIEYAISNGVNEAIEFTVIKWDKKKGKEAQKRLSTKLAEINSKPEKKMGEWLEQNYAPAKRPIG